VAEAFLLVVVLVWIPSRISASRAIAPLPEYEGLVRGSRQIAAQTRVIRAIEAPFLPPSTDPAFIYEILGGRVAGDAPLIAHLTPIGQVSYRRAMP
jgi:hypothetical protein